MSNHKYMKEGQAYLEQDETNILKLNLKYLSLCKLLDICFIHFLDSLLKKLHHKPLKKKIVRFTIVIILCV